jgi:hypothetical protein
MTICHFGCAIEGSLFANWSMSCYTAPSYSQSAVLRESCELTTIKGALASLYATLGAALRGLQVLSFLLLIPSR